MTVSPSRLSLALLLALIAWVATVALLLPRLLPQSPWNAPILFAGCVVILIENVTRSGRR